MSADPRANQGDPERSQVLEFLIDAVGIDLRSAMPGNITRIAGTSPARVDVQPAVGRADRASTDADQHDAVVRDAVVAYPLCGKGGLSFDLAVNDPVLLVFCDRSVVEWVAGGGTGKVLPSDPRTHDITDALAFPIKVGALSSTGGLWLGWLLSSLKQTDAGTMTLEAVSGKLGAAAADYMIKGTTFNLANNTVMIAIGTGLLAVGTGFTAAGVVFQTLQTDLSGNFNPAEKAAFGVGKTAMGTAATACGVAAAAIVAFVIPAATATWTSTIWKVQ
jgi:hypothetical protein